MNASERNPSYLISNTQSRWSNGPGTRPNGMGVQLGNGKRY